jgi:hypothetical protein
MEFTETVALVLPEFSRESLLEFEEQRGPLQKGLVVEVAAIHEGLTANFNNYSSMELAAALPTWTSPYPKPILLHHDPYSEAIGRIVGSRMDKEDDGTPFTRLQAAITDPEAIKKVVDKRYLTGSVGGRAGSATCSICDADWSKASMFEMPCKHQRGKSYQGKIAHLEMGDITFKEYSFVNMPADQKSGVRAVHAPMENESEGSDFMPARFFCLDMVSEGIIELGEAERNVLEGLKPTHATSLYLGLKSAFLSAVHEDMRQTKESGMGVKPEGDTEAPPIVEEEEDDVLAVAESLSEDLSSTPEESEESAEEPEEEGDEETEESEETTEEGDEDEGGSEGDEGEEEEEEGEEETTEPPAASDESADDAGDEGTESADGAEEGETTTPVDESNNHGTLVVGSTPTFTVTSGNTTYPVTSTVTTGSNYTLMIQPDPRVTELEAEVARLKEESTRLRAALKKGLAERVVDTKISFGLCEFEQREEQLEEHMKRSASSLADTIRDLAAMTPPPRDYHQVPVVKPTGAALTGDDSRERIDGTEATKPTDPEDIFVDALMGRRSL